MTGARQPRQFGEGPLSRVTALVYTLLIVQIMLGLASLPGVVPLLLLAQDPSNIALAALCAVPFGPALSAALYALYHRRSDLTELTPAAKFWRGYRLNWRAVLPMWLIGLAWLTIVSVSLANFWLAGVPTWWAALLGLIGLLALLWLTNALVITALFDFRTIDAIRLSWEMIPRRPLVMLGNAGVAAAAVLVAVTVSEFLVAGLSVLFLLALLQTSRPMIDLVAKEYTQ